MFKQRRITIGVIMMILMLAAVMPASAQERQLDPGSGFTNFTVQNLSSEVATVSAQFVNQSGSVVATVPKDVQPRSSAGFPASEWGQSVPSGFVGSVIVGANRDIAAFVQMFWQGGTSADGKTLAAYNAVSQGATKIYFPSLFARPNQQYSQITVQSATTPSTSESTNIRIRFYNRNGQLAKEVTDSIRNGAQKTYNLLQQGLPTTTPPGDGWIGSATVETVGSNNPLGGVAVTHWTEYSAAYTAVTDGGTVAYLPSATRRLPTGAFEQFTGINVQNLETTQANITVKWYSRTGLLLHQFNDSIPANSAKGYNTRFNADTANPAALFAALGNDWNGSVVIESTNNAKIVAIANLQWTAASGPGNSASAYYSEFVGNDQLFVPATFRVVSGGTFNQYTGLIVQNIGESACNNFRVEWYDRNGAKKLDYTDSLAPNISHGYNTRVPSDLTALGQNPANLGDDFRGSVVFTASAGCSLIAIHNTLFPQWTDSSTYTAFGR